MAQAPSQRWDLANIQKLDPTEHDFQEFKGCGFLVRDGALRSDFSVLLSRQVSAFANGGGGHLLLGIDDSGRVDAGGLPCNLKNGLREWLEDVIPGCVDPPLTVFNVYEIRGDGSGPILLNHAVYAIHIPTSLDAPHQARDYRYYLRIAGKSRPMNHTHIVDIQARRKHPNVQVTRIDPFGEPEWTHSDPRGPLGLMQFRVTVENTGSILAEHVGLGFTIPRVAMVRSIRERLRAERVRISQEPGFFTIFHYYPFPIFPGQDISAFDLWIAVHRRNLHAYSRKTVELRWQAFADDAPVRSGVLPFHYFNVVQRAIEGLRLSDS